MATIADMLNGLADIAAGGASDAVNWVNARAKKASEAARAVTGINDEDSVLDIARKTNAQTDIVPKSQSNIAGTIIPDVAANAAAGLPNLYGLAGKLTEWMSGGNASLPGTDAALDLGKSITDPVDKVTDAIAGGKLNRSLIDGDMTDLVGSWSRLGASVLTPAPAVIANKIDEGLKVLNASKSLIAQTGAKALTGLEVISPVMLRTPTPKVAAASMGIAGGLGVGLELAFPDPNKEKLDEEARNATTVAMASAKDTAPAVEVGQSVVNPVYAGLPSTGNNWLDTAIMGVAGLGLLAGYKRDVTQRVLEAMGRETGFSHSNVVDINSPRKDIFEQMYPNYSVHNANRIDAASGAAVATKMSSYIQYGEMPGSMVRPVMPPADLMRRAAASGKMDQVADVLNSRAELDVRKNKASGVLKLGTPGTYGSTLTDMQYQNLVRSGRINEADTAHNFAGARSGDDLVRAYNAGMSDPEVAQLVRAYDDITKKLLDYRVEQKDLSLADANRIKAEQPLLAPTKLASGSHFDGVRPGTGTGSVLPSNPLEELPNYIEQTIRRVEGNKRVAFEIEATRAKADSGDAFAKSLLGRRDVKNVTDANRDKNNFITYRDRNGVVRNQEILHPEWLRALRSSDKIGTLTMMQGAHPVWSGFAKASQSGATGGPIAIMGSPFAPVTGIYNAVFGGIMAEGKIAGQNQYRGWIDKAVRKAGSPIGLRGDPTIIADAAFRAITGIQAVFSKRLGDALHNSVITNGKMANMLGAKNADDFATALREHYKKNWVYELQQQGVQGPAGLFSAVPEFNPTSVLKAAQGSMSARVFDETNRFFADVLQAISASPGASIWMMNKHLHPDVRSGAVRDFAGDLSRSGAYEGAVGKTIGFGIAGTPWGNVYVQSMDKFLRGINTPKKALEAGIGAFNMIGAPAIAATFWNMSQGKEYSEHQFHNRSPDRKASSIYVAIPGRLPEQGVEFPVEPIMRPYKYAVELLAGTHIGAHDGSLFAPENETMRQAWAEMFSKTWKGTGQGSVPFSLLEQSILPPVPTLAAAAGAALGVNIRSYANADNIHRRNDAGYTSSDARNPFRDVMGMHESAVAENVVRAISGTAGELGVRMFMETAQRVNEKGMGELTSGETWKRNMQQLTLSSSDAFKWGPSQGLFGSFQSVSPSQESAGKLVSEKLKGLKALSQAFQGVTSAGALDDGSIVGNKRIGFQALLGGRLAVEPNDPRMIELGQFSQKFLSQIRDQMALNRADYQQRNSIQAGTQFSPEKRRYLMNKVGEQIIERNRQMLLQIQRYETQVGNYFKSQGYQGPALKLDKLNINKGLDQFEED